MRKKKTHKTYHQEDDNASWFLEMDRKLGVDYVCDALLHRL